MHLSCEPPILYFGTPVVLISTLNEDGTPNLAPMSSAFWLGWRCIIGLGAAAQTAQNLLRSRECVLNLPSVQEAAAVNRLALTTGSNPVPQYKSARGYRHVKDKFAWAELTPVTAETVAPPRVRECPVQLEAVMETAHGLAEGDALLGGRVLAFELRMTRVHVEESILMRGERNRIDPSRWRPLIMSFQKFYGLQASEVQASTLASIPEALYRSPDVDRAACELRRVAEPERT